MEFTRKLYCLFDYQRFEQNSGLKQVIDSVHAKYPARALSLDEMDMIAAAGYPDEMNRDKEKRT